MLNLDYLLFLMLSLHFIILFSFSFGCKYDSSSAIYISDVFDQCQISWRKSERDSKLTSPSIPICEPLCVLEIDHPVNNIFLIPRPWDLGHSGAVLGPLPADPAADPAGASDGAQEAETHPSAEITSPRASSHVRRFIQRRYNSPPTHTHPSILFCD